ncbi:MAG: hypothetical protein LRY71_08095 [Bacillaceae bacterium]|nr:hypothetical protein [Bacillaceae bacterium]
MPNNNQKLKILYILKILMEQTDENHPLSTNDLIIALKHYDIDAERKSIYTDIECLQDFGVDIIARRHVLISITLALGILNLQSLSFWWTPFNHLSLSPIKKAESLSKNLKS